MPGMTMYMSGFHSTLFESDLPCINLYSTRFTLNSEGKVLIAMLGVAGFGVIVEALPLLRLKHLARVDRNGLVRAAFHGLQALFGYLLMLAAMTYSIELLASAIVGISLGHNIFYKKRQAMRRILNSDIGIADSATPCCEFLQDDINDCNSTPLGNVQIETVSNGDRRVSESAPLYHRPNAATASVDR